MRKSFMETFNMPKPKLEKHAILFFAIGNVEHNIIKVDW
jgi:hypothetical protein